MEKKFSSRMHRKTLTAGFIMAAVLSGCAKKQAEEPAPVVTVEVASVQTATIERKVSADAVLFPLRQAAIVPKISAPVAKFYVQRGSPVHAGQVLAELENKDLAGAAAEARGAYQQAQAAYETAVRGAMPEELQKAELDVKSAKEAMEAQQKVYEARQNLYKEGAISGKEVDEALVALTHARSQYEIAQKHLQSLQTFGNEQQKKAAEGQLAAAKGKYESAEAQLSYTKIVSPIDGIVTDRPIFPGEMASSSAPLITVMDLSQVIARAHIAQQDAVLLKEGDEAIITSPGASDEVHGKLTIVSPALDPNSTTIEVWVQAANVGARLKPGSSVKLTIVAQTIPNAVIVPAAAVLAGSDSSGSVMLADGSKARKQEVKLGIRDGDNVQITSGLNPGQRVVTAGAFELYKEDPEVLEKTRIEIREK